MTLRRLLHACLLPAAALGVAAVGCAPGACVDPPSEDPNAPQITDFDVHSQLEDDPWTVVFSIAFTDADGDLSDGFAEFFLGGERSDTQRELFDIFRQSGLPIDATEGEIAIPLRFGEDIDDGASVRFGTQLVDDAGLRSNCASFELSFAVEPR